MDEKRLEWLLVNQLRFVTCIILLCYSTLNAQNNQLYFEQLTTADGLSQNTVMSICQDSFGFLWFGTYNGLNRYDGYTIKRYTYNRNDLNSISHNTVEDSIVDRNGILWFATGDGLCRFDYQKEKFIRYYNEANNDKSLGYNKLRSVYEDREGNFWIATYGGGLDLMDRNTNEFAHFKHDPDDPCSISNNYIFQIYEDRHGNLWIATDGGLNLFDRKTREFKHYQNDPSDPNSLSHNNVTCIFEDRYGDLWIGTWGGGLNRLKKGYQNELEEKNLTFARYYYNLQDLSSLSNNIIHDIMEDRSGNLWIATRGGGINCYDRKKGRFIRYTHDFYDPHSLSNNLVVDLFEDRSDIFWAGTYGGANKYDPYLRKFDLFQVNLSDERTYILRSIYSLFVDLTEQGDIVWLGSQSDGLSKWDRKNNRIKRYKPNLNNRYSLPSGFIPVITMDHSRQLWMGTGSGLSRFNERKEIFYNYFPDPCNPHSLSRKDVYSLFEDKDNQLWIGTYEGGLNRLDLNNPENLNPEKARFIRFVCDPNDSTSISDMSIREIYQDRDGILWFGTERGGLNRYDSTNARFIRMFSDPKDDNALSDNYVRCIYEANDSTLWIGTANGLNRLKPDEKMKTDPTFIHYTRENGLSSSSIHGILEDENGRLWISTDRGISEFDLTTGKFNNYGPEDGLQSEEFADNASAMGNSGIMYFGGSDGLNIFDPNSIRNDPYMPPVIITDFQISNQSVPIGQMDNGRVILSQSIVKTDKIELSYKDDVISFEFAGLHYGSPENNQYAYFMEGFDKDWINAGTTRKITYTNLDPGEYRFKVKASNNDGVWNEEGKTLVIHIKPPFWEIWWVKTVSYSLIIVAVPILIIYYVYRYLQYLQARHAKEVQEHTRQVQKHVKKVQELKIIAEEQRMLHEMAVDLVSKAVEPDGWWDVLAKVVARFRNASRIGMIDIYSREESRYVQKIGDVGRVKSDTARRVSVSDGLRILPNKLTQTKEFLDSKRLSKSFGVKLEDSYMYRFDITGPEEQRVSTIVVIHDLPKDDRAYYFCSDFCSMVGLRADVWDVLFQMVKDRKDFRDKVRRVSHAAKTPLQITLSHIRRAKTLIGKQSVEHKNIVLREMLEAQNQIMASTYELLELGREVERARTVIDIRDMIENLVKEMKPLASDKGCWIELNKPEGKVPVNICKDEIRISLRNLLDNAIKYSFGKQKIGICVSIIGGGNGAEIVFSNYGIGIPEEKIETIMKIGERGKVVDTERPTKLRPGTGLGVPIAMKYIHRHGGSLGIKSFKTRHSNSNDYLGYLTEVTVNLPLV